MYEWEKKEKEKTYINVNSQVKVKGVKTIQGKDNSIILVKSHLL